MAEQQSEEQALTLKDQMGHILEEARMVLPGIQALFGFQTVAVFNERFADLPGHAQACHLAALALVSGWIALDLYVVIYMMSGNALASLLPALFAFVFLNAVWFAYPLRARRRHGYGTTDKGA